MKAEKVYLVGFMAAGKTTIARALAKRLDWRAIDIDEIVSHTSALPNARPSRTSSASRTWSWRPAGGRSWILRTAA